MADISFFKNNQYTQMTNQKYKIKYRRLKRCIKNYVFENAALCDQIAQIQENIAIIKEERRFLLKKLSVYETDLEPAPMDQGNVETSPTAAKRGPKKRLSTDASTKGKVMPNSKSPVVKKQVLQTLSIDSQGRPILPIYIGNLTLHSLGEITENTNFHSENWIYPIGYTATRIYAHPKEPEKKCTFTCKILDNSGAPQFQIIPDADFEHVFFGESANICHLNLLEAIVKVSDVKGLPLRAQGELFFGLGHPTIMSLLQSMLNNKKCINFKVFHLDGAYRVEDKDPTINFEALQKLIAISAYHTVPEIKEEPPDELLE